MLILLHLPVAMSLLHEVAAHWDVHYATPRRRISIWEMHVHNYMATMPLYLLMLDRRAELGRRGVKLASFDWAAPVRPRALRDPHGSPGYLRSLPRVHGRAVRVALPGGKPALPAAPAPGS